MTPQDAVLYMQSAEIHAAVYTVAHIAMRYRDSRNPEEAKQQLFEDLIQFFGSFDRVRTDQLESLKVRLIDALSNADPRMPQSRR